MGGEALGNVELAFLVSERGIPAEVDDTERPNPLHRGSTIGREHAMHQAADAAAVNASRSTRNHA